MARAIRYVAPFRREFAIKAAILVGSLLPLVALPWPTRILIDNVIGGIPLTETTTPFPFFMQPFVDALAGSSTGVILAATAALQMLLLLLIGAMGATGRERDRTDSWLSSGWDTATRTENEANSGFSEIGGLLGLVDFRWTIRLSQKLNHHYRSSLFERIQALPMTAFDEERIGDAVYRVMYDTPTITATCYRLILTPIGAPISILLLVSMIGSVYGWGSPLVWAGLSFFFVALVPTLPFAGLLRRRSRRSRETGATTTSSIEESLSNILAVQSLGGEDRERGRFDSDSDDSFRQYRYEELVGMATFFSAGVVGAGVAAWVVIYVCTEIIDGNLTVGDFAVVLTYFTGIAGASVDLGAIWVRLQGAAAGLERVFFLMDAPAEDDPPGATPLAPVREGVAVEGVSFSYDSGTEVLSNVTFEAPVGAVTALAGPAGAGKTSIAYLIPRFIAPDTGRVLVDGRDLAGVTRDSLRDQIAFVFQETVLFDDTVEENIRFGNPEATETEVRRAARTAGAHEFIQRLPQGYATPLGRGGGKLSVGQRQRIAIARALVRDAPILILDEPTSALDPETERALVAALHEASRTRVVIVIAHRLSTIREADQILFLKGGEIIERGTHDDLMEIRNGEYRGFVELQRRGAA